MGLKVPDEEGGDDGEVDTGVDRVWKTRFCFNPLLVLAFLVL